MLLNRVEFALMNNPVRAVLQRHFEARRLLRMGGPMCGGRALDVGCGQGVGTELILDLFGADSVDAFDLDPRMVTLAAKRLAPLGARARVWVGDAADLSAPSARYEAVFDFGILHHVPDWRKALTEIHRVLKPGGRLYCEEGLRAFIVHPVTRRFLDHPLDDRFDVTEFTQQLRELGFESIETVQLWRSFAWFVARKLPASCGDADSPFRSRGR